MILDRVFGMVEERVRVMTGYGVQEDATLKAVFGDSGRSSSGINVDAETSLGLSAFYDGVRLLAWTRAQLPLNVYRREANGDRAIDSDHPIYNLIHTRPNRNMTSSVYREMEMKYVLLWGDSISWIERDNAGVPIALWPLHPGSVKIQLWTGTKQLQYDISSVQDPPTNEKMLRAENVLHVPGFGFDGLRGRSVIGYAREQLGSALAAQQFGASFWGNGARPGVVIRHPGRIKDAEGFKARWEGIHKGPMNSGRTAILEDNADIKEIGMPLEDAQFLQIREHDVAEVARWLGLPPHKLGDLRRATFSNIAEQNIEFVQAILPWLNRFEQEYDAKLFLDAEQQSMFVEHVVDGLLAADPEKQNNAFATALQNGWMSRNEVRRLKNLNSIGEEGNIHTVQVNLVPIDKLGEVVTAKAAQGSVAPATGAKQPMQDVGKSAAEVARASLIDSVERVIARETWEVIEASKRPEPFLKWMDRFYQSWPDKMRSRLVAVSAVCQSAGIAFDPAHFVSVHSSAAKAALLELSGKCHNGELEGRVKAEVSQWKEAALAALNAELGE
jgi:HK97 family phage portal protein